MSKQKVRWRQSNKSGQSYKRDYHKQWRLWQKAVKHAKAQGLPIPALTDFVDKADYTVTRKRTKNT